MFHSSEGRAQDERINEGKTDNLKNNKNNSGRGFLHAAKGVWFPTPFCIIADHYYAEIHVRGIQINCLQTDLEGSKSIFLFNLSYSAGD